MKKMGKYDYNENVGTQHEGLVAKGDTMANKKVKVYTYKRVSTSMQVDGYSLDAQNIMNHIGFSLERKETGL